MSTSPNLSAPPRRPDVHRRFSAVPAEPTGRPAVRSSAAVLRLKLIAVLGTLVLAALAGPLSLVIAASKDDPVDPSAPYVPDVGRAAAQTVANDWAAGRATAVPVASEMEPTLSSGGRAAGMSAAWEAVERSTLAGRSYETHRFLVSSTSAKTAPLRLWVTLDVSAGIPTLVAAPSVAPLGTPETVSPLDYSTVGAAEPTEALAGRVSEWAGAWVAGGPAAIKRAAADQDPSRTWNAGLGSGWKLAAGEDPAVSATSMRVFDTPWKLPDGREVPVVLVRARVSLVSADGLATTAEYDLIFDNSGQATAPLLAYGPAGAGPTLRPYTNTNAG